MQEKYENTLVIQLICGKYPMIIDGIRKRLTRLAALPLTNDILKMYNADTF